MLVGTAVVVVARSLRDLLHALGQRAVDGGARVVLDRRDEEDGGGNAGERHRRDGGDRDARAQAPGRPHGRRTHPTPRIVCSTRGSPAASSLRRT